MSQKSLLFITTQLPYPPVSGGIIKTYHLLEFLSKHYKVYFACPLKKGEASHVSKFKEKVNLQESVFKKINKPRSVNSLIKSYIRSAPLNVYRNYNKELEQNIHEYSKKVDLLIVDHYEMGAYVPKKFTGKVILHQHNAEYILWQSMANTMFSSLKKTAVLAEVNRIKKSELAYCRRADMVWAAPNDIEYLKEIGVKNEKLKQTLHLGNDGLLSLPSLFYRSNNKTILFVGTLTWEANIVGLAWFIKKVFPLVLQREPKANLIVVGKTPDQRLLDVSKDHHNIVFKGFIPNLEEVYLSSSIAIAPLLFGSGMKVKVLESMYRGIPMVTTKVGIEGIKYLNNQSIGVSNSEKGFADLCVKLFNDKEVWSSFSTNARRIASKHYQWNQLLKKHHAQIETLLNKP